MAALNSLDVMRYISGVAYPARRTEIIDYARDQGAGNDEAIMSLLNRLERSSYDSSIEVEQELDIMIRAM